MPENLENCANTNESGTPSVHGDWKDPFDKWMENEGYACIEDLCACGRIARIAFRAGFGAGYAIAAAMKGPQ